MKKFLSLLFILLYSIILFGQQDTIFEDTKLYQLNVEFDVSARSADINDGEIIAKVTGGNEPYIYKWSNAGTPQDAKVAKELTEGQRYTLTIIDANKDSIQKEIAIPAESINEKFNSALVPVVNFIGKFLMADIFALLHIYDPVLRNNNGEILQHPNGTAKKMKIPFIVIWLVFGAIFFTIKMGFINIRGLKHSLDLVRGKYDNPNHDGEVTHFQALTAALSATVGLGNIAGVAIAIAVGGPGATLWLIVAGFFGMSSKFVECTLGVKYRDINKDGVVSGGPMYYMTKAFKKRNMGGFGKVLAIIFAILIIGGSLGGGNMFQANQAFAQVTSIFPSLENYGAIFGIVLAILVGIVIIGGIKSIAKVTDKIVPIMAGIYILTALIIIVINISHTGEAFKLIFNGAFSSDALKGGVIGVMIVGFQRAAFSNEAGVGSAAIAHAAVKTKEPVTEGLVAMIGPFIDTVVICTMTALVIIFTGLHTNPEALNGVALTSSAFESVFTWFPYILVVAIMLFAFSTMISWSYYGLNGFKFLFGKIIKNEKIVKNIYYALFLIFVVIGAASSLGAVIDFSDMMILSMAFPNILALLFLSGEVRKDLKSFLRRIKSGEIKKYK